MSAVPTLQATGRVAPPAWAVKQREVIDLMNRTASYWAEWMARPDGTLKWRETWGGMDGTDNGYEIFIPYPQFYLAGGGDHVRQIAQKEWDAITWQFTQYGAVSREFVDHFDWFHHSESYPYLWNLALADPEHYINRKRAIAFAAMYIGEDPLAPNWDPKHRLIRAPINGSGGPRLEHTTEDWVNHRPVLAGYHSPWEDFPGLKGDDPLEKLDWNDEATFATILKYLNERIARGDVPLNLHSTSLVTHAYLFTGDDKYKTWVLDYLSAWAERAQRNGGVIPDNVGLDDQIGQYNSGKWWGGYYGWRWPHGSKNILEPILCAGSNALLMTGDDSWLDLHRQQLAKLWELHKEEDGKILVPNRHGDIGWFDYKAIDAQHFIPHHHIHAWYLTQKAADRGWLDEVFPDRAGFERNRNDWPAFKGGPCPPNAWFAYIEGRNPGYPEQILEETRQGVINALERIAVDDADVDEVICNHYHRLIPVAAEGLIQMQTGSPSAVYNGELLFTHLCYFDPERKRIGVPEGVAALCDQVSADGASVTLVNTNIAQPRRVLVQAGMFGEHEFTTVQLDGGKVTKVGGKHVELELGPSAQARLTFGMKRFAHRPAYGHPEFR